MSEYAIRALNVGKQFQIGAASQGGYKTLRESLSQAVGAPFRRASKLLRGQAYGAAALDETIWALSDVTFEVKRGEVVGIIGGNGAGKSTLLKILSRITEPTEGEIEIHGRVGSLLEVGTGFHPELTGRENIYLNGAILGMAKAEIQRKFDEIVAFAEVEKFIDTPVKHYSSGMYLRLAFSVAAHLEPEILLVDEVLAVGDVAFQKKCLGKMGEVAEQGRTVLFVSHNMGAMVKLCQTGLFLQAGKLESRGAMAPLVAEYLLSIAESSGSHWVTTDDPSKPLQVLEVSVVNSEGLPSNLIDLSESIKLIIRHRCNKELIGSVVLVSVFRNGVELIHAFDSDVHHARLALRTPGHYTDEIQLPSHLFKAGVITVSVATALVHKQTFFQNDEHVVTVNIAEIHEDTSFKGYAAVRSGILMVTPQWKSLSFTVS